MAQAIKVHVGATIDRHQRLSLDIVGLDIFLQAGERHRPGGFTNRPGVFESILDRRADLVGRHDDGIVWAGNPTAKYEQAGLSGLEHVNLAWAGNPSNKIAAGRSNRLEFFKPLAGIEGVQLYGLQKGAAAGQAEELSNSINVINLGEEFEDFSDTAGVIENLDLIITVDTSVAHLAGAMGKPVWVLIPYVPDWRWMLDREDSPWYPTMRLFRQQRKGDWDQVFERVADELGALVSQ